MTTPDNYSSKLLNARTSSLFITIPQTTIQYRELHTELSNFKHTKYIITKLEQHEDKGLHIHILIQLKETIRISAIHNLIMSMKGDIKGLVDYDKPKHLGKSINYCKKEDTSVEGQPYLEYGETSTRVSNKVDEDKIALLEALKKAEEGNTEEALEDIKQIDPMKYIQYKNQIKENLKTENKIRKKYKAPNMSKDHIKLKPKQQVVWDMLQETPKARRIIWVSGPPGCGKSHLMNYIHTNHEYLLYNAGQSAAMDNVAYGYDEEGVIAWDLPKSYNFAEFGDAIGNVIEKFSDFGQTITSKKYNGKTQTVLGHVIVFSNHPPIHQLAHRDVVHIDMSPEEEIKEEKVPEITIILKEDIRAQQCRTPFIKDKEPYITEEEKQEAEEPLYINTVKGYDHIKVVAYKNKNTGKFSALRKYLVQLRHQETGTIKTTLLPNEDQAKKYCPPGYEYLM